MIKVKIDFGFHILFVGMVALVVTGTAPDRYSYSQRTAEIIKENFETEVCYNIPEYPLTVRHAAAGSWDDGKVTVCGGWTWGPPVTECYSLENGEWKLSNMQTSRFWHAASNVGNSVWITGNGIQMSQKFQISIKI